MNFKKITSIILSTLIISSQSPIQVDAMRSGVISPATGVSSTDKVNVAKSYALGLVCGIKNLSYSKKVSIPRFISSEEAKKHVESVGSLFTPTPKFSTIGAAEAYVGGLASKIFRILKENEAKISFMTPAEKNTLTDEIFIIINEFHHLISTLGDDISDLPDYLSNLTKHDVGSMPMLTSTVSFVERGVGLTDYSNPTGKITITPRLKKSLITYHLTMLFMNESFGKYLGVKVRNDSHCHYTMCPFDSRQSIYHSLIVRYEGVIREMLSPRLEPNPTKWELLDIFID